MASPWLVAGGEVQRRSRSFLGRAIAPYSHQEMLLIGSGNAAYFDCINRILL
ncbi:hypothetical protein [Trichocoleus sp. FACHB-262]|uniref:hypothetical protein n=1 Tax=Trichocoleus sp. FACHB-262 TaxID=2692869 RepID=UPI001687AAAF|nr:hypothetical protein [Trichocoleus sp. FACHB-262]MBD2119304.1 hypothetical protein [Trichocoleus sp. FACHB-262]